jgi:fatty acid desaturase
MWQHQHTYSHHSYTNEPQNDPDLHHFTYILRVHKKFQYDNKYQYQSNWWYVVAAYLFTVFGECVWIPYSMLETGTMYSGVLKFKDTDRPGKVLGFRLHLAAYTFIVMIIPLFTHSSIWRGTIAVTLHIATLGITFAIFSQINHLTEDSVEAGMKDRGPKSPVALTTNPSPSLETDLKLAAVIDSWAAAQVETSNNFAPDSLLWHVLSNGLNHQIEHHLFPGLNHCHLHHIAPVVRKICEEYGVNYTCYDNWTSLWGATLAWYDKLSIDNDTMTATATEGQGKSR